MIDISVHNVVSLEISDTKEMFLDRDSRYCVRKITCETKEGKTFEVNFFADNKSQLGEADNDELKLLDEVKG